jgi:acyl-coenzyme A synthetase/AMP-(fatty) acid ligase
MNLEVTFSLAKKYGLTAKANPKLPAIIREERVITHDDFWQIVRSFAIHLREEGVSPDSLVALNTNDRLGVLATLFATSLLGARFVSAGKILAGAKILRPTHFFRTPEVTGSSKVEFKLINDDWMPTPETRALADDFPGCVSLDGDWLYVHTSGTTGHPKFIGLSEKMVIDRTNAVTNDFPYQQTTLATTFGAASRPFFARAIATLLSAGAIMDTNNFDVWTRAGVNVVCGSPMQISALLRNIWFKPPIERIEVSGAKLPDDIAADLIGKFKLVVDVYGAAETNKSFENIVSLGPSGKIVRKGRKLDSEIEIISPSGEICGPGKVGSIRVRNPYMAKNYLQDPQACSKSFRNGWFYPGDIATWGENGGLSIIAREDDVINLGGYKLNAGMLDLMLCSVPGIREAISFHNPKSNAVDKVLAYVVFEIDADRANTVKIASELVSKKLGFTFVPASIRPIDAIPRTEEGNPYRLACRTLVLQRTMLS